MCIRIGAIGDEGTMTAKKCYVKPEFVVKRLEIRSILECLYEEYRTRGGTEKMDEGLESAFIRMLLRHMGEEINSSHIKELLRTEYQTVKDKEEYVKKMQTIFA